MKQSFISPGCPWVLQYLQPLTTPWTSPCLGRGLWSDRKSKKKALKNNNSRFFGLTVSWNLIKHWYLSKYSILLWQGVSMNMICGFVSVYLVSMPVNPHLTCSMWLTSKMEQCSLVCMCEAMWLSLYWTGMLQPANSTIFPPWALWKSKSWVFFKGACEKQNTVLSER